MTEESAIDRAFESILSLTENRSKLLAVIVAMVRDFDVAEDLFQETVLEILKCADRYETERAFVPWACGIAKNVVRRYWERESCKPRPMTEEMLHRLADIAVETDADLWREEQAALQRCLEKLPARLNRLFILRYGHNIKGQDLAERAGIRLGSIRTTLSRLRTQLRRCIGVQIGRSFQSG